MALPVLETPKYKMTIPTTKEEVEFRPFLVKEEKLLLIAQESNDTKQITEIMIELINACTFNKVNANTLTSVDLEYAFLQLRAKSVGETIQTQVKCAECGELNEVEINIDDIQVVYPDKKDNKIEIQDGVGLVLKPFTVKEAKLVKDDDPVHNLNVLLSSSIETVYTKDELIDFQQCSLKEQETFVDSLSHEAMEKIQDYLEAQPKMSYIVKFKCIHCGHENEMEVSGLAGFFA